MQSQIIYSKLQRELNNNVETELQVVYILLQIRKLLETKKLKSKYHTLNLYCNWVLHGRLDHSQTIKIFLNKFDPYINNGVNSKTVGRNMISNQRDFFVLNELKTQLSDFFKQNNLPDILTARTHWTKFMKLLLEILMECPIKIAGKKIDSLSLVKDNNGKNCYRFHLTKKLIDNKNIIKIKMAIE